MMSSSSEHVENAVHRSSSPNRFLTFKKVLDKLRNNPLSITPEDARRLSEQVEVTDRRSASIVSAVESLALASQDLQQLDYESGPPHMVHEARHTQHVLVNDLKAAVDSNPNSVTHDLLEATQEIVSKMQQAIGAAHAPQLELEPELQKELVRIKPKIEESIVAKAEANRLDSLEARAHGQTEEGGLTATAQSLAPKRERALTPSDENQAPLDHPNISKGQLQAGATSASELVGKEVTNHTFAENRQIPNHTRNNSAVEAH